VLQIFVGLVLYFGRQRMAIHAEMREDKMATKAKKVTGKPPTAIEIDEKGRQVFRTPAEQQMYLRNMECPWLKNPGTKRVQIFRPLMLEVMREKQLA
jgi:hypothetical protein